MPDVQQPFYTGAPVSPTFLGRWRGRKYVGAARPYTTVQLRRGYMHHALHTDWPSPQFGQILGHHIRDQWYPTWTPTSDWLPLPGVDEVDIDQTMAYAGGGAGNGIAVSTITCDNATWAATAGALGAYHTKQRGWLWPWRGYVPTNRPGATVPKNQWYDKTPNAQLLVTQGYGSDAAVKVWTGLIDTIGPGSMRPDRIVLTSRDFGGLLVDRNPFAFNRDKRLRDPMYFIPPNYPRIAQLDPTKHHNYVVVKDAAEIVMCALRWSGFKEWQVEMSGVGLKTAFLVDRSSTWMDVINAVAEQLGYVFFISEPTQSNDLSIGVPIFRKQSVLRANRQNPTTLDSSMLTDVQPTHNNANDRFIIRVRGALAARQEGGRPILGGDMTIDGQVRVTFTYWPPWMQTMAGVIKQLTYYNIGAKGILGFQTRQDCAVAAVLIAAQIALGRDTAQVQCPANPGIGLDSFTFVKDDTASGVVSRLYVTARKMTWVSGSDSGASGGGSSELLWSSELTGSLVDNPEWDHLYNDYRIAITTGQVQSSGGTGQFS